LAGGRATWDLNRKWDVGVTTSTIYSLGFSSRQYGMGFETGYRLIGNMWISTGYNLVGFHDADLAGEDVTRRGAFLRMRFKFDENIFSPKKVVKP
jgi:large repetitive protein